MSIESSGRTWIGRREALRRLGAAGLGLVAAGRGLSGSGVFGGPAAAAALGGAQTAAFPEGAVIRTILRDMAPAELAHGSVLFHEHMSLDLAFWDQMLPGLPNAEREAFVGPADEPYFMQDVEAMVAELRAAGSEGVSALVDGGHADMGRDLAFLRSVSEQSGMPIVASGGYYIDPFYPPEVRNGTDDEIAESLAAGAAAERWGAFGEIGSSEEITADERKVFRAVGKAHLATNLPIYTHTANGLEAEAQLDIFDSLGVSPDRVVIGHVGGLEDPDATVHRAIAARGAYVGFDRLGGGPEADGRKVPMVQALLDAGHAERVLLASDFALASDLQRNGGAGYAKTITRFVPMLREAGVDDATIHTLTIDNPLRFLAFVPPGT
jgi:phosphotriesterase-related protein